MQFIGTDPTVTSLIDNVDFYIVPVLNPDGYRYTWTQDRLWRKNRSARRCSLAQGFGSYQSCCQGVDLNRNFDWVWNSK